MLAVDRLLRGAQPVRIVAAREHARIRTHVARRGLVPRPEIELEADRTVDFGLAVIQQLLQTLEDTERRLPRIVVPQQSVMIPHGVGVVLEVVEVEIGCEADLRIGQVADEMPNVTGFL